MNLTVHLVYTVDYAWCVSNNLSPTDDERFVCIGDDISAVCTVHIRAQSTQLSGPLTTASVWVRDRW